MISHEVYNRVKRTFISHFGRPHTVAAYAPGRVEVLGNHTDYNEGLVLSAAIDLGTFFLAAPSDVATCRVVAEDISREVVFDVASPSPSTSDAWANYVKGVFAGLSGYMRCESGFLGMFSGNIPLGAGLSSSAALEMASGLAFCSLYGIELDKLDLARIGQASEHEYAGVRCGLLDQISSLFGCDEELVMSDFRSLAVENVHLGKETCFLVCNTNVKHNLVDSEYNERRKKCEEAAAFFASVLDHPVSALRDVTWDEWRRYSPRMDPVTARRAAHIIGENARVMRGRDHLMRGDPEEFGKLMFESHESSRTNFENSCRELDFLVAAAQRLPCVLGARLSGGGFGGSAVVLLHPGDVEHVGQALSIIYEKEFRRSCDIRAITPSAGAKLL